MHALDELNSMPKDALVAALDGVFEHAPWVAAAAAVRRPFATVEALHDALMAVVRSASEDACLEFLRGHPPLSAKALADPGLTASSRAEQSDLGLASLGDQVSRLDTASEAYQARFGFPFIVCVRRQTPRFVLRGLERRLGNTPEHERAAALAEIGHITRLRLVSRVRGPGMPATMGHLSSHVLDTMRGCAAEGVQIELLREGVLIKQAVTNPDGRSDPPLLTGEPLRIGRYELRYHAGAYFDRWFAANDPPRIEPPWFDVIPICFGIAEPEGHYHIPLLLGRWTYTTYRGS